MSNVTQLTYDEMIAKIRQHVDNGVEVWVESGSVMLGFGDFVAEVTPEEIEHYQDND